MRSVRLALVLVVCVVGSAVAPCAEAGYLHKKDPPLLLNYIHRCLGIGWSDGYHAYGSRSSWRPPMRVQDHARLHSNSGWSPYVVPMPTIEFMEPSALPPQPTPASETVY